MVRHAATTNASTVSVVATMTRVSHAAFCTPCRLSSVSSATAPTPVARVYSGQMYAPAVIAIAAQDAVLPTTNAQPAMYPQKGPRRSRP